MSEFKNKHDLILITAAFTAKLNVNALQKLQPYLIDEASSH